MLDQTLTLPEDPEELRSFTARLLAEVKAQAILIEKLRHQLAGHPRQCIGADGAPRTGKLVRIVQCAPASRERFLVRTGQQGVPSG